MKRTHFTALALALGARTQAQSNGGIPQNIAFNTSGSHGPDGPWNYITLKMGSGPQSLVDFYPMFGSPASLVLAQSVCAKGTKPCLTPVPGYYDNGSEGSKSAGSDMTLEDQGVGLPTVGTGANFVGNGFNTVDSVDENPQVENMTLFVSTNMTSHVNKENYIPVSLLSLEPVSNNASHLTGGAVTPGQQTLLQAYVAESNGGSGTVGLHMGSAALNQSGSLYLGGYDQNRLIEPPAVFENLGAVNLSSISFGHAAGLDPWANSPKPAANFVQQSLNQDLPVFISPHVANWYFPQQLCDFFGQYLPIKYDSDTNLYLWNTTDPLYTTLMTSPAYMNFTFRDRASTSIKVPFALLNLTLTTPVKSTPTQYFPCQPRSDTTNLGRAFLQAVMLIQSYDPPRIILGQAPGPSVNASSSPNIQTLDGGNPTANKASNAPLWTDTWAAQLKPLSSSPPTFSSTAAPSANGNGASSSSSSSSASSSNRGLSGGTIAGIVIGVILGLGLIGGAIAFFLIRKRRAVPVSVVHSKDSGQMQAAPYVDNAAAGSYPMKGVSPGVPGTPAPAYSSVAGTAPPFGAAQEIDGREGQRLLPEADGNELAEVAGGDAQVRGFVAEMPGTSGRAELGGGR